MKRCIYTLHPNPGGGGETDSSLSKERCLESSDRTSRDTDVDSRESGPAVRYEAKRSQRTDEKRVSFTRESIFKFLISDLGIMHFKQAMGAPSLV